MDHNRQRLRPLSWPWLARALLATDSGTDCYLRPRPVIPSDHADGASGPVCQDDRLRMFLIQSWSTGFDTRKCPKPEPRMTYRAVPHVIARARWSSAYRRRAADRVAAKLER